MKLLPNRLLPFAISAAVVGVVVAVVVTTNPDAAFGQAIDYGTGPQPTAELSPGPTIEPTVALTATAEPTVVVTAIPTTATASPEPTSTPTSEDLWAAMIADLLGDALEQFREDMRVAVYEDAGILFNSYAENHSDHLIALDHRVAILQEKLDTLDNLIGVSRDVSYNTTQISDAVNARLVELSSEITNLQLAIAGLKQIPTPGPASTVTAGGVVISNCNQCVVGQ